MEKHWQNQKFASFQLMVGLAFGMPTVTPQARGIAYVDTNSWEQCVSSKS